jgi:signal peptidase II
MRYRLILCLAACIAVADQLSKWVVNAHIPYGSSVEVASFFNLVHIRNYGAAFGIFNNPESTWQFWLFLASTLLVSGVLFFVAKGAKASDKPLFCALGCILGGALGNLVDRLRFQSVVDFLDFHLLGFHWPAFNVADIFICLGVGLAALIIIRAPAEKTS